MSVATTENLGLKKPTGTEFFNQDTIDNENMDIIDVLGGKVQNSFSADANRYIDKVFEMVACEESEENGTLSTGTYSTSNVKIGSQSILSTLGSNSVLVVDFDSPRDFSKLNSGEIVTDDDWILVPVTILGTVPTSINVEFAKVTDVTEFQALAAGLVLGFQVLAIPRSSFVITGSPSWDDLDKLRMFSIGGDITTQLAVDKIQIVKDFEGSPNPFQYMGVEEYIQNSGNWAIFKEFGKVTWRELAEVADLDSLKLANKTYKDFTATLISKVNHTSSDFQNALTWKIDYDNRIRVDISAGQLRLFIEVGGVAVTKPGGTINTKFGDELSFKFVKKGSKIGVMLVVNDSEVAYAFGEGVFTTGGSINIGTISRSHTIKSMSIGELEHAHHSDISEVSKASLDGANYEKTVDVTGNTITVEKGFDNQRMFFTMPSKVENATITFVVGSASRTLMKYDEDGNLVNAEVVIGGLTEVYNDGTNFILALKGASIEAVVSENVLINEQDLVTAMEIETIYHEYTMLVAGTYRLRSLTTRALDAHPIFTNYKVNGGVVFNTDQRFVEVTFDVTVEVGDILSVSIGGTPITQANIHYLTISASDIIDRIV